jgi:hypothetical protein
MQKEYTGWIRNPENKNAGHDFYQEDCLYANTVSRWQENLYSYVTKILYVYFGERDMFNNAKDKSEEQERVKSTGWITFTIAVFDGFHVKTNTFLGPILSVKFYFNWVELHVWMFSRRLATYKCSRHTYPYANQSFKSISAIK